MLTDAQYRALKEWPDETMATIMQTSDGFVVGYAGKKLGGRDSFHAMRKKGLVYRNGHECTYTKIQPACTEAIREYEEGHK